MPAGEVYNTLTTARRDWAGTRAITPLPDDIISRRPFYSVNVSALFLLPVTCLYTMCKLMDKSLSFIGS